MVWMRKSRRVVSQPLRWEPTLEQPLKGIVLWTVPESHQITVTLFKNSRNNELEDKYWSFVIEDVTPFFLQISFIFRGDRGLLRIVWF